MKNKRISIILATIALILSGCGSHSQTSSSTNSASSSDNSSSVSSVTSVDSSSSAISSSSSSSIDSSVDSSSSSSSSASSSSSMSSSSSSSSSSSTDYSVPPVDEDTNWNINLSLRGAEFRNALQTIMARKRTKTISYSDCLSTGAKAAAYPNSTSSTFVPFYHDSSLTATIGECNREHTWPNSRGSGKSGPGADPFIIRPTLTRENTSRGNLFYGNKSSKEWDPASCGFEGARGESARVILYAATMYYRDGLSLSNNPSDDTSKKTMGTLSTLLEWNVTYAPTPIEIQINNYLSDNGYGRNPFVDHPQYANYIWDNNGLLGGEIPPDPTEFDNGLDVENSLSNLDGNEYVIASSDSNTTSTFYAMGNEAKGADIPWYIKPINAIVNSDKTKLIPDGDVTFKYYKFTKQSNGKYYIQSKETDDYLYGYIDGTHYSIGLGTTPIHDGSLSWDITTSGSGFVFKNDANVYLEYYGSSFCGYSKTPSVPIYLFH